MSTTNDILAEVRAKAEHHIKIDIEADAKGEPPMPLGRKYDGGMRELQATVATSLGDKTWASLLAILLLRATRTAETDAQMREGLVAVAGVAVAAIAEIDRRAGQGAEQSTNPDQPDVDKAFADLMGANYTPDEQEVLTKTEEVYSK